MNGISDKFRKVLIDSGLDSNKIDDTVMSLLNIFGIWDFNKPLNAILDSYFDSDGKIQGGTVMENGRFIGIIGPNGIDGTDAREYIENYRKLKK